MKLFKISYKHYNTIATIAIVAANPAKALDGAKIVLKAKYAASDEIVSVEKVQDIDRVEK
jgi:hypothetical protein